jgi:putative component of toxin-antitoxin plasmid stabilization module
MPFAKPVGGKLWELRVRTRPAVRILYGFRRGVPILLAGFIKQKSAIPRDIFEKAKRTFREICIY